MGVRGLSRAFAVGAFLASVSGAHAASYVFAEQFSDPSLVSHPIGYDGTGGSITVTVGIDQTSAFANDMVVSVENAVRTFNELIPTTNNFSFGDIPNNQIDFESVLLHELGHSLGLAHVNLASESMVSASNRDYAKSGEGANGVYDLDPGADGVKGTADDVRGDDLNFVWFNTQTNDPFDTNLGTVDSTTYSSDIADLPTGDLYPVIATRQAAAELGYGNTESVMVQGSSFGEIQRSLAAQDVAGLLYARSGLDSIAGTADDYTVDLQFVGLTDDASILIDFDNTETGFAVSQSSGKFADFDNVYITSNNIYFNTNSDWYFNEVSNAPPPVPLPASGAVLLFGLAGFGLAKRRGAILAGRKA